MTAKPTETRSYENFIIRYSAHVTPYDYNANVARKKSDDDEGIRGAVSSTNRSIFDLNNTTCKCAKQCVVAWEYICRGVDTLFFYHTILFFFGSRDFEEREKVCFAVNLTKIYIPKCLSIVYCTTNDFEKEILRYIKM